MLLNYLFELFLVVRFTGMTTSSISNNFLIQDKFCRIVYNQTEEFCQNINNPDYILNSDETIRDEILVSTTKYSQLQNLIEFFPMVAWSLFVGSFLDKTQNSTKWLLVIHIFAEMSQFIIYIINEVFFELNPYYMLLGSIPIYFSGGMTTFLTTTYRFIILISCERTRRIRLMLIMFAVSIGMSTGHFTGGQLLSINNLNVKHSEIRTYWKNYVAAFTLDSLSIILLILTIKYVKKEDNNNDNHNDNDINDDNDHDDNNHDDNDEQNSIQSSDEIIKVSREQETIKLRNIFKKIFDIDNVRETILCITRPRSKYVNFQIYTIYGTYFLMYFVYLGMQTVALQFCEKVYGWNSIKFSTISSISSIVSTVIVTCLVLLFIKKLKLSDSILIVTSLGFSSLSQIMIGTFLTEFIYFVSIPIVASSGLTFVCVRNKLSNMIPEIEVGRIFSLISTIESVIPLISSIIYSNIFSLLIATYPGTIYHFNGFLFFLTMLITIFENYYCKSY